MQKSLKVLFISFLLLIISTNRVLAAAPSQSSNNFFDQFNIIQVLINKINDLQNQINNLTKLLETKNQPTVTPVPTIMPTIIPTSVPTTTLTPTPTIVIALPTVTFTASGANGQVFNTNKISVTIGTTVDFVYSSTNAANCYAYVFYDNNLMGSTNIGVTQGATSGKFKTTSKLAGTETYKINCFNANGKQTSKSITLNIVPPVPLVFNIRTDGLHYVLDNQTVLTMSWDPVPGTVKYNVRRKLASDNDYPNEVFASTGDTTITVTLDSLHDYKFKVSACKTADDCTNSVNEISVLAKG